MKLIFKTLKNFLLFSFLLIIFFYDLVAYKLFKSKNREISYQFMIKLFLLTGGMSNNFISKILSIKKIDESFFENKSINYEEFKNININDADVKLNDNGFFLKENFLDDKNINIIKNYLFGLKGKYISDQFSSDKKFDLDLKNPKAIQFRYDSSELLDCNVVQDLMTNNKILQIANNYLKATPLIDEVSCWWSFPSDKPDSNSAQFWHFDMDRPKWLKVFIFLTDCSETSGPHCYIAKTHKNHSLPFSILKKGYARIEDELIYKSFPKSNIRTFVAKKGSILFEDTRGLHKGQNVIRGKRLMLQLQYSSAIFGSKSRKLSFPKSPTIQFLDKKKDFPNLFLNFE